MKSFFPLLYIQNIDKKIILDVSFAKNQKKSMTLRNGAKHTSRIEIHIETRIDASYFTNNSVFNLFLGAFSLIPGGGYFFCVVPKAFVPLPDNIFGPTF